MAARRQPARAHLVERQRQPRNRSLGGGDPAFQVTDEGDTRDRSVGDVVGKHELRS